MNGQQLETELNAVLKPVEQAFGLPSPYYLNQDLFMEEQQKLFNQQWACIGFAKDVAEIGTLYPVNFLNQPMLIARDRQNQVRVYSNVCRHRGMILVDEVQTKKTMIRCPYHYWCYGLDGALKSTPHFGGSGQNNHSSFDRSEHGLYEIRSHIFMDMVFVNVDGKAPAFEEYAESLYDRWSEFVDQPLYHGGEESSFSLTLNCNWKLAVENYCESYHLPFIHPGLNSYSKLEDHYTIVAPDKLHAGQGTVVYNPILPLVEQGKAKAFPNFDGLSTKWDRSAEYVALFPNVLLGVHRDHFFSILLTPLAPNQTHERIELYYSDETVCEDDWKQVKLQHADLWREVFIEDVSVVEGMQRGRTSPNFDGGRMSPVMDTGTYTFHQWAAERLS